jgi:hypothetical protein
MPAFETSFMTGMIRPRTRARPRLDLLAFERVRLDGAHSREILLRARRQIGEPLLDLDGPLHELPAGPLHDRENDRIGEQREHRQPRVDRQHDRHRIEVVDRGVDEVQDPRPEEHPHRADVVHQARHQVAGLLPVVVTRRELLEVGEEVVPQIVFDVAADVEDDEARERTDDALEDRERDHSDHVDAEPVESAVLLDHLDRLLQQVRDRHRERRGRDETGEAEGVSRAIARHVCEQSTHSSAVASDATRLGMLSLRLPRC